jgi:peroxiredoxin
MKKFFYLAIILLAVYSCKEKSEKISDKEQLQPVVAVNELLSNESAWWTYQYNNISLSSNYKALDTSSNYIPKAKFLWYLTSGNYIPIEMKSDSLRVYKLYKIPSNNKNSIETTIKNLANSEFKFYQMAGKDFPQFEAKNLENELFNNNQLIGKKTIIKTWFINCKPCIEEMPELNKLVEQYEGKDVQFISLALDKRDDLIKFLQKREFKYATLPEQEDLIKNKLELNTYPTHLIIDKAGKIEKVFSKASELISYLEEDQTEKEKYNEPKLPPPPPPATISESAKNDA